ncbi:hypothetical protein O9929_14220 [Vibrio lentus]|nr:hypothetical protein [Vibrio lentus]
MEAADFNAKLIEKALKIEEQLLNVSLGKRARVRDSIAGALAADASSDIN